MNQHRLAKFVLTFIVAIGGVIVTAVGHIGKAASTSSTISAYAGESPILCGRADGSE